MNSHLNYQFQHQTQNQNQVESMTEEELEKIAGGIRNIPSNPTKESSESPTDFLSVRVYLQEETNHSRGLNY